MITWILLGGALSGAGVLMLILILAPPAIQPAAALAELDSQRDERRLRQEARRLNPRERALPDWLDALGYRAAALLRRTGIDLGPSTATCRSWGAPWSATSSPPCSWACSASARPCSSRP